MKKVADLINDISKGKNLSFDESKSIFLSIMSGNISEDLIFKFLINLSKKEETADESCDVAKPAVVSAESVAEEEVAAEDCEPVAESSSRN